MSMRIFILISVILLTALTGCERISEMVQPDSTTTPTETTLKIGVIQPSNTFTTFSQGAETARVQINEKGGVLGMEIAFIGRDNQPVASEPPTPEASVTAAKELIEVEDVSALLGARLLLQFRRSRSDRAAGTTTYASGFQRFKRASSRGLRLSHYGAEPISRESDGKFCYEPE